MNTWLGRGLLSLATGLLALTLTVEDVEAKRMGGGRSIGRQSTTITQQRQAQPPAKQAQAAPTPANPAAATQPTPRNRWMAPLAGLAAGLGIAALLSHFGLGETFASILTGLLLVAAIVFIVSLLLRRGKANAGRAHQPAYQYSGMGRETVSAPPPSQWADLQSNHTPVRSSDTINRTLPNHIPEGFDSEGFVRNAKVTFMRLQAAFDNVELNDLREFTSPEMFAELRLQLQERVDKPQRTDVVTLNAELLGVENSSNDLLASVRFTGMLREEADQATTSIDEVWNFSKPHDGSTGWVLAGIQQLN